jgi:hypothetical protein
MKHFVLNSNAAYCSIIFANNVERTNLGPFYKVSQNVQITSRRLQPDSCQTHRHKTDSLSTDSRQAQTPPDTTTGSVITSLAFLATRVAAIRI